MPQIGIALAAYQPKLDYFREQLASIQAQSFTDWICVITFDSPVEETVSDERIRPFTQDPRFIFDQNPSRLGHKKNFERAIRLCVEKGAETIACSDQDDVWYPQKLAVCVAALNKAGPLSLVHSDMHILGPNGVEPETTWVRERRGVAHVSTQHLLIRNVVAGCTMMLDAELVRRFPVIPEGAEYHDHWYALVASRFGGVHPIAEPLMAYRQHGENTVGVSPFHGTFWVPESVGWSGVFRKCAAGWSKSRRLAEDAARAGLPLSPLQRLEFLAPWDLGLGVLAMGVAHLADDKPLARACIARSVGKPLSLLFFGG